ncbi:hemerythrin domain-containing protein [Streptosporangium sp. NPDC051023]|uniref:hemerythrin domain-containing protein n=1 Tax=Streptosporangium sp. NPDC051023 TaxID=3155410 RepID=UPI00344B1DCC
METPVGPDGRLAAFGNQLIDIHLWLREELAQLREDVDAHLEGRGGRPRELRAHCLAFCSALTLHHTGEDDGMFPVLAERFPELRPVIEELVHDHQAVAGILRSLEDLLGGLGAEAEPDPGEARRVRAELDGLTALLESHFVYEEKKIVAALNALGAPGPDAPTSGSLPGSGLSPPNRTNLPDAPRGSRTRHDRR